MQAYCPDYPQKQHAITARQLLIHTSGVRHYIDYDAAIAAAADAERREALRYRKMQAALDTYARFTDVIAPLDAFKDDALLFAPGEGWEYSSFGYRLLACVLQGAAAKPYEDLMYDLVFSPVGMGNTLKDDAWAIIPHRVSGYRLAKGDVRRADMRDVSENLPAGGYLSTATDLARFAMAFGEGLLPQETVELMSRPVTAALDRDSEPSWRDAIPQADKYGYGLMLFSKYVDGMVGHTGRQAGGSAVLVLEPRSGLAIAVMTNAKGWNGFLSFVMELKGVVDRHIQ